MECYFPGRILVGHSLESEGTPFLIEQISEELRGDFEFQFSIADVLIAIYFELDYKRGSAYRLSVECPKKPKKSSQRELRQLNRLVRRSRIISFIRIYRSP